MLELTLYTRPGCHLCDDAAVALRRLQADLPFTFSETNIDLDPSLRERYGDQIPVIAAGERLVARAPIVERRLRALVERELRPTSPPRSPSPRRGEGEGGTRT